MNQDRGIDMSAADLNQDGGTNTSPPAPTDDIPELDEQLHIWYLEAAEQLSPLSTNPSARVPYDLLTDDQKFIDKYIADKVASLIRSETAKHIKHISNTYQTHITGPSMVYDQPTLDSMSDTQAPFREQLTRILTKLQGNSEVNRYGLETGSHDMRTHTERADRDIEEAITAIEAAVEQERLKARIAEADYLMRLRDDMGKFKIKGRIVIIDRLGVLRVQLREGPTTTSGDNI